MTPEWAAVLVAGLSLSGSIWALVQSSRANAHAKSQAASSERQAVATEAQAQVARRQLELMEEQHRAVMGAVVQQSVGDKLGMTDSVSAVLKTLETSWNVAVPYVAPWVLSAAGQHAFLLSNGGDEPAFDVNLSFDVEPARAAPVHLDRIDPRASVKVMVLRAFGASPDTLTVSWRRTEGGQVEEWSTALP